MRTSVVWACAITTTNTRGFALKPKNLSRWMSALLCVPLVAFVAGCGGNSNSEAANVRVLNATHDYGAIDFYTSDTERFSALNENTATRSFVPTLA